VLDTDQILALLEERGIRNVDIANALGLPDSRIPEIKRKSRALKLDEGVKLVRAFGLELNQPVPPLPPAISRLIVRHLAEGLGAEPDEARLQELSEDIRAFSEFVADPKVRRLSTQQNHSFRQCAFAVQNLSKQLRHETILIALSKTGLFLFCSHARTPLQAA
jgi:hypothetical protein